MDEFLKKMTFIGVVKFLVSLGIVGTLFTLYRNVIFKEDLTTFETAQEKKLTEHKDEMNSKYRSLLCFACRVPQLATDSKCTESCTSKATFNYQNKTYEAVIVADLDATFRTPATIGQKPIYIDGKLVNISEKFKQNVTSNAYHTVILKTKGQNLKPESILGTMNAAAKAKSEFKIERFNTNNAD